MASPFASDMGSFALETADTPDLAVARLDSLPIALATLRKLGVATLVDDAVGPAMPGPQVARAHAEGDTAPTPGPSVGTCLEAMILNVFEGRVALSQMEHWLRGLALGSLWGPTVQPQQFTDDRLARALDRLHGANTDTLYSRIIARLLDVFPLNTDCVHSDTSSLKVWGAYAVDEDAPGPRAERGYSKDHRPDLLQFVFGMTVQSDGIPLASTIQDGNTSDPLVYRDHLRVLRDRVRSPQSTTFVGDSKLCAAEPLGLLRATGWQVTTLMPHTFGAHARLCTEALATPDAWSELLRRPGRTRDDPEDVYRGCVREVVIDLAWPDSDGESYPCQEKFRALVVHSSQLAQTQAQTRAERLERRLDDLSSTITRQARESYACEADARAAVARFTKDHAIDGLMWTTTVASEEIRVRRPRAGRPRANEVPTMKTVWRATVSIELDPEAEAASIRTDGLFILVTSHRITKDHPASKVLTEYRGQHQVESGFRWIKDPAHVGPLLLHTPSRIDALAFVFTVTLLLDRLMQWQLRRALAATKSTVPGHNGIPTATPTTTILRRLFVGIYQLTGQTPAGTWVRLLGFTPLHRRILALLDLPPDLYEQTQTIPDPARTAAK